MIRTFSGRSSRTPALPDASPSVPAAAGQTRRRAQTLVATCLVAVMALELLARLSELDFLRAGAHAAMLATIIVSARRLGFREAYLLSLCGVLTATVWMLHPEPGAVIRAALDQAAFLMAFILLLGLLYEAAATSPSVAQVGEYLTRQPPDRRYYALYSGTGFLAVLFNIGVMSFLVPLIQRGIATATPGDPLNPIRERRQVSATLRGFAWSVIWSPTAIAPLALLELIPGIDRPRWILIGFALFLVVMVLGAFEDRLTFLAYRPRAGRTAPPFPGRATLRFLLACLWLLSMSGAVAVLADDTVVFGLMVACPAMLIGWLLVQNGGIDADARRATVARLRAILLDSLPKSAPVAVTLASSGFIGRAAAALVPAERWASALGLDAMPDFVLLSLMPIVIALIGLFALSPIMVAVFFGSLIGSLAVPPADPTLVALSISCGWALSMHFSPFATVVLLINRVGDIPATTLTWKWNLVHTIVAAVMLVPIFAMLTGGR